MKVNFLKIVKISIGCCLAVLVANAFGLRSSTAAGIITLLSIQNTKRETLSIAGKRIAAFFTALVIAFAAFTLVGFNVVAFGVFLLLFTFTCYLLKLEAGISMSTVLVTHFWTQQSMSLPLVLNEFLLLCIGVGIAVLVNLYMPRGLPSIRRDQQTIDESMRRLISDMAQVLDGSCRIGVDKELAAMDRLTSEALQRAYDNRNNTLAVDMRYYVEYIEMRIGQLALLQRIYECLGKIEFLPAQAKGLSGFMRRIAASFHEYNNAGSLLEELHALRQGYKSGPLPVNRAEFEARAVLFQIADNLEQLLWAKKRFAQSLEPWQIEYFWKAEKSSSTAIL